MKRDQSHPVGLLMTRFMINEFASSKAQDFPEDSLHSELRKRKGYSHYRMRSVKEKVEDAKVIPFLERLWMAQSFMNRCLMIMLISVPVQGNGC